MEEASEMLPHEPPPWISSAIAWLLIGLFVVVILAAISVHLPDTVQCPFVLVPKDGADPIQSPYLASISRVGVTEGAQVPAGAELFALRSDEVVKLDTELQTLQDDLNAKQENSAKLEVTYHAQIEIQNSEISQAEREVAFREKHAGTSRDLVERLEKLESGGGISEVELIQHQLELAGSEKDLNVAQKSLEQSKLELQRMQTDLDRQRTDQRNEIEKLKVRIAALRPQLENVKGELLSVRAPYDAIVISLSQRNTGSVVQPGQELCQLARVDKSAPEARLFLNEQGLSRLAPGQLVRLFFQAFPYQRFGTVDGRLVWISPAAISQTEGRSFVALASLGQTSIQAGGEASPLRVGMKGDARIITGHRSLWEYAFEPIRQLRENTRK